MSKLCGVGVRPWRAITVATLGALAFLVVGASASTGDRISCGATVTQDTKLDHDLIDCPGNGIVIGADNITLDLNGHTIDGCCPVVDPSTAPLVAGVNNQAGHDGVTIEGGTIRQFFFGVLNRDARGNAVRRMTLADSIHGISLVRSDRNVVERNHIINSELGVDVFFGSDDAVLRKNAISGSVYGVWLLESSGVTLEHNEVSDSITIGINIVSGTSGLRATHNRVLRSRSVGILVVATRRIEIARNEVSGSGAGGILLLGANDIEIEHNSVSRNGRGIELVNSSGNEIEKNSIVDNARNGISLPTGHGYQSSKNRITRNFVWTNDEDGIFIGNGHAENLVFGNAVERNGDDGIDVGSAGTTLTHNVASRNGDLGIEAVQGVIDGGGNRARGNGNALQCLNVACS